MFQTKTDYKTDYITIRCSKHNSGCRMQMQLRAECRCDCAWDADAGAVKSPSPASKKRQADLAPHPSAINTGAAIIVQHKLLALHKHAALVFQGPGTI